MFGKKILCPFCFQEFSSSKLVYRCMNQNCTDPSTPPTRHIILKGKTDKSGICTCDACGRPTGDKLCPHCRKSLPNDILNSTTKIISIIGAPGAGKSYMVGALLYQIIEAGIFARLNNTAAKFSSTADREQYDKRFGNKFKSRVILDATNKGTDIISDNPPILIELAYMNKHKQRESYTMSFFDAAGETFTDPAVLAAITPYISHSEAVVLLLDPMQMPAVSAAVKAAIPGVPAGSSNISYSEILENTVSVLRTQARIGSNKQITHIPLCIAFSKWDLLINTPDLIPPDFSISRPGQHLINGYDDNVVNNASDEVRSLISEWEPNLVSSAEQHFATVKYFGFSATGSPITTQEVPTITPFRVEDPLLWMLHRNKIV